MSTAAAAPAEEAPPLAKKGKKKLIIILAAALLVVLAGGTGAYFVFKKKAHADEDGEEPVASEMVDKSGKAGKADKADKADPKATPKRDPKTAPTYVPLEVFTVNLADREVERYAQIGITLELMEAKDADQVKVFMPAIRNNILMVLAQKTSQELFEPEGKVRLAGEVQRAASRALGVDVKEPAPEATGDDDKPKKKKKIKKAVAVVLPIYAVHFSNFIVQ